MGILSVSVSISVMMMSCWKVNMVMGDVVVERGVKFERRLTTCEETADCDAGQHCHDGECHGDHCVDDTDCGDGEHCHDDYCEGDHETGGASMHDMGLVKIGVLVLAGVRGVVS
eukprot:GHVN01003620.1.p1 GENE.GHVN01003620.1~~GHVN01003620.1.p1  ORF type:complete len:114 (-),score=27.42 GHVN01003620.1:287-628(-)